MSLEFQMMSHFFATVFLNFYFLNKKERQDKSFQLRFQNAFAFFADQTILSHFEGKFYNFVILRFLCFDLRCF